MQRIPAHFLILFFVFHPLQAQPSQNPAYRDWLDTYRGEFEPLRYVDTTFKGNRRANNGSERLAPPRFGKQSQGLTGNYFFAAGAEQTQGLNQALAYQAGAQGPVTGLQAKFKSRGRHFQLNKRLFRLGKFDSGIAFSYRHSFSDLSLPKGTQGFKLATGENVSVLNGKQNNYFFSLDWTFKKSILQKERLTAELLTGIRFSDMALRVRSSSLQNKPNPAEDNLATTTLDYHFRNLGVGPIIGLRTETPLSRTVRTGLSLTQILLPSKGNARKSRQNINASGNTILQESNEERKFTSFPITEIAWDINFFFDHSTRIHLGYFYTHWNLYEIQGFSNENFQDISSHGPRASFQFLF
jgi:hypothetical protein